jgi:hypothetical protein
MTKHKHPPILTTQLYRKDHETGRYMIEVALRQYEDIFNEWDPSPFRRRDLHPDLTEFLEECSSEISLKHPLSIVFHLSTDDHDHTKHEYVTTGLRNHFSFSAHLLRKRLKISHKHSLRNLAIGIAFLLSTTLAQSKISSSLLADVFTQGLFIGGWVFVWEALATVVFADAPIRNKIKEWERFLDAPIIFKINPGETQQGS